MVEASKLDTETEVETETYTEAETETETDMDMKMETNTQKETDTQIKTKMKTETQTPDAFNWWKVVDMFQMEFRDVRLVEESTQQAVVIMSKGSGNF